MPQSLALLPEWTARAHEQGLIDADERQVLDDYARYGAEVLKVDDFAPDFGMLEALQKRKEALEKALQLAA
jgi:acyl-CoA dehydrogenase